MNIYSLCLYTFSDRTKGDKHQAHKTKLVHTTAQITIIIVCFFLLRRMTATREQKKELHYNDNNKRNNGNSIEITKKLIVMNEYLIYSVTTKASHNRARVTARAKVRQSRKIDNNHDNSRNVERKDGKNATYSE